MVPLQSHKSQHSSHGACHCAPPHDGTDKGTGADDWAAKNRRASMATTSHHPIIARRSEAAERRALSVKEVGRGQRWGGVQNSSVSDRAPFNGTDKSTAPVCVHVCVCERPGDSVCVGGHEVTV